MHVIRENINGHIYHVHRLVRLCETVGCMYIKLSQPKHKCLASEYAYSQMQSEKDDDLWPLMWSFSYIPNSCYAYFSLVMLYLAVGCSHHSTFLFIPLSTLIFDHLLYTHAVHLDCYLSLQQFLFTDDL